MHLAGSRTLLVTQPCGKKNDTDKNTKMPLNDRPERRTALIAKILHQYQIDIAALSETRFLGGSQLEEVGGGYTFYCILNRLITHVADTIIPESQCGFRAGRGTSDMVFATRQLHEKCREQNQELHMVFVDLSNAFDTVNRNALWKILRKFGCSRETRDADCFFP